MEVSSVVESKSEIMVRTGEGSGEAVDSAGDVVLERTEQAARVGEGPRPRRPELGDDGRAQRFVEVVQSARALEDSLPSSRGAVGAPMQGVVEVDRRLGRFRRGFAALLEPALDRVESERERLAAVRRHRLELGALHRHLIAKGGAQTRD